MMPLGLTMHGKWDDMKVPMQSFKPERNCYSTPQPVENTPSNNECRVVEVRGARVASFILRGDEYICLPQAFDLFLKNLVGGLHTVYTKLKRLNITPVVCNVEQVRILRGLGAIQPGVNRCKLITRDDFEILFQDCTQASRPGRPAKRYPTQPPSDMTSVLYPEIGTMAAAHGILGPSDLTTLHKRLKLHRDSEKRHNWRRLSDSPPAGSDSTLPLSNISSSAGYGIQADSAHLYLQIHQALRRQYHQDARSFNSTSGIFPTPNKFNANLAPLMMYQPSVFNKGLSAKVLNHLAQYTNTEENTDSVTNAAAVAAAQIAVNGGTMQQQAAAAYQVAAAAQSAVRSSLASTSMDLLSGKEKASFPSSIKSTGNTKNAPPDRQTLDNHEQTSTDSHGEGEEVSHGTATGKATGVDEEDLKTAEESIHKPKGRILNGNIKQGFASILTSRYEQRSSMLIEKESISSMQTLLKNIQGLIKVAADNARLQQKQSSFEIAELKNRMSVEKNMRENAEKRLEESEKMRAIARLSLKTEKIKRQTLHKDLCGDKEIIESNDLENRKLQHSRYPDRSRHGNVYNISERNSDSERSSIGLSSTIETAEDKNVRDQLSPKVKSLDERNNIDLTSSQNNNVANKD